MLDAVKQPDGTIVAPARAEGPNGIIGDGVAEYRPGDPGYDEWDDWLTENAKR